MFVRHTGTWGRPGGGGLRSPRRCICSEFEHLGKWLALVVAWLLPLTATAAQTAGAAPRPDRWMRPGPVHKVVVERTQETLLRDLRASDDVRLEVNYGSFSLFVVDEAAFGGRAALRDAPVELRDRSDLMPVNGFVLDGLRPQETLAALHPQETLGAGLAPEGGLYLVQFVGPARDAWFGWLEDLGARVVQYIPDHAYVVSAPPGALRGLESLGGTAAEVQYVGNWQPAYRMTPTIRAWAESRGGAPLPVTVQLVAGPEGDAARLAVEAVAERVVLSDRVGPYENLWADVDPAAFRALARLPGVFALERRGTPERSDERQGQIVAGNRNAVGPSGPGYLSWLQGQGFGPGQFTDFVVNVVDDATTLRGHPDLTNDRIAFELNPSGNSTLQGGHGFFNAQIVGGLNVATGSSFEDNLGYNYGLGVAPWARMAATNIFGPSPASASSWERQAFGLGARISSNSWRYVDVFGDPINRYDASAQTYDFLVRDAVPTQAGLQETMIVFAAGNSGPGPDTVSTPGTAKNVLTVGASENFRPFDSDGCVGASGADDYQDIIGFSSRGPVNASGGDGRAKPELVAPGTHIQSGVPLTEYGAFSLCDDFYPPGQTLYSWSSGTSHSAPAVAGGAAIVRQWFSNWSIPAPSPAMLRTVLVNSTTYLQGDGAGDTLPGSGQGMGLMDLGRALANVPRLFVDQTELLTQSGAVYVMQGAVGDTSQPLRVTLAWTDAPGTTTGAPFVNDLDLELRINGQIYRGNGFSGPVSVPGTIRDPRNNVESVFLPAGTSGVFEIRVIARALNGDGVPGNGDATDQDFALMAFNAGLDGVPQPPTADFFGSPLSGQAPLEVHFQDQSTGAVDSWLWDFGDGTTSTLANPSHVYATAGNYTVSLTAAGPFGSDTRQRPGFVSVSAPPTVGPEDGGFEAQPAGARPGHPWRPYFGAGHVVQPAGGGAASDAGMPTEGQRWLELSAATTYNARPPSNPGGYTVPATGGSGYFQDFQYGTGRTTLRLDAVFVRMEGIANAARNDWMSIDVSDGVTTYNVFYRDTFSATAGSSALKGGAVTPMQTVEVDLAEVFPGTNPGSTFRLSMLVGNGGDGTTPSFGYVDDIRLVDGPSGGGPAAPVAAFDATPTSGVSPLKVDFTDRSTGVITSWSWFFGDGTTSFEQNPLHVYQSAGTFSASLQVTGPGGTDVTSRMDIVIVEPGPPPVAGFALSPAQGVAPLAVSFQDLSTGDITSHFWEFGDGQTSTLAQPTHVYGSPGSYNVKLTVGGPFGSDSETRADAVTVSANPAAGPLDGSFEGQPAGSAPSAPWRRFFGGGHLVSPSGTTTDGVFPSHGSQWLELSAEGTYAATPPSTPGGVTLPSSGGAGVFQDFNYEPGRTRLWVDAVFMRQEGPSDPLHNDWMSIDVFDGQTTINLYFKDTFSPTAGSSAKYGYAATLFESVSIDLAQAFPGSSPGTTFRLTALMGNGGDGSRSSRGYIDNVRLTP